jgi:hypothetical protein
MTAEKDYEFSEAIMFAKALGIGGVEQDKETREDMERYADIIRTRGGYINNHNGKFETKIGGLVLLDKGEVSAWFGGGSCLNRVYYNSEDGMIHLSTCTNGGIVYRGSTTPNQNDIDEYNKYIAFKSISIVDFIEI